jgi:hypothetical protein
VIIALTLGCSARSSDNQVISAEQPSSITNSGLAVVGYDYNGFERSCVEANPSDCDEAKGPSEIHAAACLKAGQAVVTCGCHDVICKGKVAPLTYSGFDIEGKPKDCTPKGAACGDGFSKMSRFGQQCKETGANRIQCDCDTILCENKITFANDGYNATGQKVTCPEAKAKTCTEFVGTQNAYAKKCEEAGSTVVDCGCSEFLCQDNIAEVKKGYNISGANIECAPVSTSDECSAFSEPAEAFSMACKDEGHQIMECGCHEYLCSAKVSFTLQGYDSAGLAKSCLPSVVKACTEAFGPAEKFEQDCKKAGFRSYMCGCHDYLCDTPLPKN